MLFGQRYWPLHCTDKVENGSTFLRNWSWPHNSFFTDLWSHLFVYLLITCFLEPQSRIWPKRENGKRPHWDFADLPAASTFPLLWGYVGELVTWAKPQWRLNSLNSSEINCEPLSDTHVSGIPCLANWAFNFRITVADRVSSRRSISQKEE